MGSTVLKGVEVGERAVIGANSTLTGKIPKRAVAAGNPVKIIRIEKE